MAFYYHIAKHCSLCGVSFIADFFTNEKYCLACEEIIEDNKVKGTTESEQYNYSSKFEYDEDIQSLLNPCGYRKRAIYYD